MCTVEVTSYEKLVIEGIRNMMSHFSHDSNRDKVPNMLIMHLFSSHIDPICIDHSPSYR